MARARVGRAALGACWLALGAALLIALADAQGQGVSFEPVEPQARPVVAPKPKPKKSPRPAGSPRPGASPRVTSPRPAASPRPGNSPRPPASPRPGTSPRPPPSPRPGTSPKPEASPRPAASAKATRPTTASSPRAPLTTEERAAMERARTLAAFAVTVPPGWRKVDPGNALAAFADARRPGVTAAVYLESRERSEPVTEALVKIFRERTRGTQVWGRSSRGLAGRVAVFADVRVGAVRERMVIAPRDPGRRSRQYFRMVLSMPASGVGSGTPEAGRLFDSFRVVEGKVVRPTPEEEKLAAQIVRGSVDAAPDRMHRDIARALASGEDATPLVRQWPLATEVVLAGLEPDGPEARAAWAVRRAELFDVARRVVKEASKKFPHQVVGVEVLEAPELPGLTAATAGGFHRYRGTETQVGGWMAYRARDLIAERGVPERWRLVPNSVASTGDAAYLKQATLYEAVPKTGALDERGVPLEEVFARNRWVVPPVARADALVEAGLAYRRYHQAVRQAPAAEQALRGARQVVRAAAAAAAAGATARTTEELAALAFHRALAERRDVARALEDAAASVAPVLGAEGARDPLAAALTLQPLGERLVEQGLREALAARIDEVAKPRAEPDAALQVTLENTAARGAALADRQIARRLLARVAAAADPAARRALLEHALVPGTEALEVALLGDLAWVPRGARERLVAERADAARVAAQLPAVRVLAHEDAALHAAARWLDRRVRAVAPGACARLGEGKWRRVAVALGPSLTACAVWGRVDEVARAVERAGDPMVDAAAARALAGAFVRAAEVVRRELAWLDDAGGTALVARGGEDGEGAFASLRAARELAVAVIERAGGGDAALAERVLAGPWLDHAHEGSVYARLGWTPWTLAADLDARPLVEEPAVEATAPTTAVASTAVTTSTSASAITTALGTEPAPEAPADARLVAALEEALAPELAGAERRAVRGRVVAVLGALVEPSRGALQRLGSAAAKDRKRRERMVAQLLESGSSGVAAAVALSWGVEAVNRGLRAKAPR